jgi:hypothetical protein
MFQELARIASETDTLKLAVVGTMVVIVVFALAMFFILRSTARGSDGTRQTVNALISTLGRNSDRQADFTERQLNIATQNGQSIVQNSVALTAFSGTLDANTRSTNVTADNVHHLAEQVDATREAVVQHKAFSTNAVENILTAVNAGNSTVLERLVALTQISADVAALRGEWGSIGNKLDTVQTTLNAALQSTLLSTQPSPSASPAMTTIVNVPQTNGADHGHPPELPAATESNHPVHRDGQN